MLSLNTLQLQQNTRLTSVNHVNAHKPTEQHDVFLPENLLMVDVMKPNLIYSNNLTLTQLLSLFLLKLLYDG